MLWEHINKFDTNYEEWYKGDFKKLNSEQIEKEMK